MKAALFTLALVAFGVGMEWWVRSRKHLELDAVLATPWYLYPLARVAIYRYWRREIASGIFEGAGMVNDRGKMIPAYRWVFIDEYKDHWRVRIRVPNGFPVGDDEPDPRYSAKSKLVNQAREKGGLGPVEVAWKWRLANYCELTPRQVLPEASMFQDDDVRELVEAELTENPTALPFMLTAGERPYHWDVDKIPHMGISAGTGGGKSALIRLLIADALWADARTIAIIADRKEFSQRGLAEIPGVIYARRPEEINAVLVAVWHEVERRNAECASLGMRRLPNYPRIVLGLEELNITYASLNSWWRQHPDYNRRLAEGIYALDQILCAGRQVKVNCIVEGQDVNNRVVSGSGAGTVNIDEWILASYDQNTWNRLAYGHPWMPASTHAGWCVAVRSNKLTVGQRIFMADGEPKYGGRFDAYEWLKGLDHSQRGAELERFMLAGGLLELTPPDVDEHPPGHHANDSGSERYPQRQAEGNGHHGGEGRYQAEDGVGGGGAHDGRLSVGHDSIVAPGGGEGKQSLGGVGREENWSGVPEAPGCGADTQPLSSTDDPSTTQRDLDPACGFSSLPTRFTPMQGVQTGVPRYDSAQRPNYRTLSELATRPWASHWKPGSLARLARTPGLEFPEPVIKGGGRRPSRFSEDAVRDWVEDYMDRGGEPGLYVVRVPGDDWKVVKLGESMNLRARLRRYQQYHAADPWRYLLLWIPCESKPAAQELERWAKEEFAEYHEDLEFYRYEGRLAEWVERERAKQEVRT